MAKRSIKHPETHPLDKLIPNKHVIPGIESELHPGLTHRYSHVQNLIQLSRVSHEIKLAKKKLRKIVLEFEEDNQESMSTALQNKIKFNLMLINIEIQMRMVDLITQRDILLQN